MNTSEPLVSTKCHHTFHQNCMTKYIESTPFCPTCKNSVNNSSLIKFTLPSGSSTPQGAIPKRITRSTRSSNRTAHVKENADVSSQEQVSENRTVVENLNQNELTNLYKIIESLSQKLERLEMNINSEPQFPRELFPPITNRTSENPENPNPRNNERLYDFPNSNTADNDGHSHNRNQSSVSSVTLTNSSKVVNLINSWNVKFDGNSTNFPVNKFIYMITALTNDNLGGDFQLLCDHFHILLIGRAREWYWEYRSSVPKIVWQSLCKAIKSYFADHFSDNDIREMIRDRKQLLGESFEEYYSAIMNLCGRLKFKLSEIELVEMLRRNLRPQLRKELFYTNINNVSHLRFLMLRREQLSKEMEKRNEFNNLRPTNRKVNEIEFNEVEEEFKQDVSEIDKVSEVVCWNCRQKGHRFTDCLEERSIFCYGCGTQDVKENLERAYNSYRKTYNLRAKEISYKVGFEVYRRNFALSSKAKNFCAKLAPKFLKCRIDKRIGNCYYELSDLKGRKIGTFHAKDLRPK
ncbi:hypothetical protein CVS40_4697 [Lucilia cuprina]|nr:hypothetical protein CVS40_4697 [Lucilia cuprina]